MGFLKFLGTAGARFVMLKQLRYSGGIWISHESFNGLIDPGPGSLVRCQRSRPSLDPSKLDAVFLTHKHLDHSNDVNVMIEAMTQGGFKKRGYLYAPADSFGEGGVVFSYTQKMPQRIEYLKEGAYSLDDISFEVPVRNQHSVETYGLTFHCGKERVSFISDTKFFPELASFYKNSTILVLNVVFLESHREYEHLSLNEALDLVKIIAPRVAILTHFGMGIINASPRKLQSQVSKEFPSVIFAYDGMQFDF